jgi:hypothetical protein
MKPAVAKRRCRWKSTCRGFAASARSGIRGLGQTLKSFRDRPIEFPVYQKHLGKTDYLDSLGPLIKPTRGSRSERALPPERVAQSSEPAIVPASAADAGFPLAAAEAMPLVHAHL